MKKYIIETQSIILKIYFINFPIYIIKFPVNFKYSSSHLKSSQYSQENICVGVFFNKFIGLQACNFTKKRIEHWPFPVNIAKFKNTYFEKHLLTSGSDSSYILHRKLNKIIQEADWPSRLVFCFFWNIKSLYFTYSHLYSFALSLAVIRCHSLSFLVTHCHSLSLAVPLVATRCITCCHSFVVPLDVIPCYSLSFVVPRVVIRCHSIHTWYTRLSFFKRSLIYNFLLSTSLKIKTKTKKILSLKF